MSRGRPKRNVRDLSRDPPAFEDHDEMRRLQTEGPDLVLAITAAAQIEYEIEQLIIGRLKRRDQGTIMRCTENNGPMSGLHAKAVLAYAMGILDEPMYQNINIIRLIRNAFAHARRPIKFDAPEVMAELRSIHLTTNKRSELYKNLHWIKTHESHSRERFSILCSRTKIYLLNKSTARYKRRAAYMERKNRQTAGLGRRGYFGSMLPLISSNPEYVNQLVAALKAHPLDKK